MVAKVKNFIIITNGNDYYLQKCYFGWGVEMEKIDVASAYRRMKSPNIKTKKRALKIIKASKAKKK